MKICFNLLGSNSSPLGAKQNSRFNLIPRPLAAGLFILLLLLVFVPCLTFSQELEKKNITAELIDSVVNALNDEDEVNVSITGKEKDLFLSKFQELVTSKNILSNDQNKEVILKRIPSYLEERFGTDNNVRISHEEEGVNITFFQEIKPLDPELHSSSSELAARELVAQIERALKRGHVIPVQEEREIITNQIDQLQRQAIETISGQYPDFEDELIQEKVGYFIKRMETKMNDPFSVSGKRMLKTVELTDLKDKWESIIVNHTIRKPFDVVETNPERIRINQQRQIYRYMAIMYREWRKFK